MADTRKDCCKKEENLAAPEPYEGRRDLTYRQCGVCGCRHFRARAEGRTLIPRKKANGEAKPERPS